MKPEVHAIEPSSGAMTGVNIKISGAGFQDVFQVLFAEIKDAPGGHHMDRSYIPATGFIVDGDFDSIFAFTPVHPAGLVDVIVVGPDGWSEQTFNDRFRFEEPAAPPVEPPVPAPVPFPSPPMTPQEWWTRVVNWWRNLLR